MTTLVFRDENEIPFCYSHVSRRDRDFRKSFLVVEREKMKMTLVENSRDREFSLTSDMNVHVAILVIRFKAFLVLLVSMEVFKAISVYIVLLLVKELVDSLIMLHS